jgi:hypothetical protein
MILRLDKTLCDPTFLLKTQCGDKQLHFKVLRFFKTLSFAVTEFQFSGVVALLYNNNNNNKNIDHPFIFIQGGLALTLCLMLTIRNNSVYCRKFVICFPVKLAKVIYNRKFGKILKFKKLQEIFVNLKKKTSLLKIRSDLHCPGLRMKPS